MENDYSEFYHHEYDGCGAPFIWISNRTHTIFMLKGSKEAAAAAVALTADALLNESTSEQEYEKFEFYQLGGYYVIDIRTNNFIPQLYDAIKSINGVESVDYTIYDEAYAWMITSNKSMGGAIRRERKLDVEIEVDDEPDMFPEKFEFSLPDLNEPD